MYALYSGAAIDTRVNALVARLRCIRAGVWRRRAARCPICGARPVPAQSPDHQPFNGAGRARVTVSRPSPDWCSERVAVPETPPQPAARDAVGAKRLERRGVAARGADVGNRQAAARLE